MPEFLAPTGGVLAARLRMIADGSAAPNDAATAQLVALNLIDGNHAVTPMGQTALARAFRK